MGINSVLDIVGNTPMVNVRFNDLRSINLYAKLEYYNPMGSVKDRAASYIIKKSLRDGIINENTVVIESSSGNFGIALAACCKKLNIKFICAVDPKISVVNKALLENLSASIITVTQPSETGGYLLSRLKLVKELLEKIPNSFWVNQYANFYNAEAYYYSLGNEICQQVKDLDYIFVGVSSGGTITGVSRRIKKDFPKCKVIAVDVSGSVIFGGKPSKRYIPGIGSEIVPDILKFAYIDDVVIVSESETINACYRLLNEQMIFAGGSSGSVMAAIFKYFKTKTLNKKATVVTIIPDRGDRYINTIYNKEWVKSIKAESG